MHALKKGCCNPVPCNPVYPNLPWSSLTAIKWPPPYQKDRVTTICQSLAWGTRDSESQAAVSHWVYWRVCHILFLHPGWSDKRVVCMFLCYSLPYDTTVTTHAVYTVDENLCGSKHKLSGISLWLKIFCCPRCDSSSNSDSTVLRLKETEKELDDYEQQMPHQQIFKQIVRFFRSSGASTTCTTCVYAQCI